MTEEDLENRIRNAIHIDTLPDRASFTRALSSIDKKAEIKEKMRYNWPSIWKPNFFKILLPSLTILIFISVGAFALYPISNKHHTLSVEQIATEDETLEEPGIDYDDPVSNITSFDEPAIDELTSIQNEI